MRAFALLGVVCLLVACEAPEPGQEAASGPLRVVSLNPSLTAILLDLRAAGALVGVDEVSAAQYPELAHLPRVGGLFSPSLEAVVGAEPDLVVLVPSVEQRDFRARLEDVGVRVESFENLELEQVLENISRLGRLVGREPAAASRVEAIRSALREASRLTAGGPHPKTLVVLQRDPVFVVGQGGFIDELLEAAGAANLGARFAEAYPQVSVEWLVSAGPEVLIDMTDEPGDPLLFWSRWPAIPAVAAHRVLHLDPRIVTLPGPQLDRGVASLVEALHGPGLAARLTQR